MTRTGMNGLGTDVHFFDDGDVSKGLDIDLTTIASGGNLTIQMPDYIPTGGSVRVLPLPLDQGTASTQVFTSGGVGAFSTAPAWTEITDLLNRSTTATWTAAQNFVDTQVIGGRSSGPPGTGKIAKYDATAQTADVAAGSKITNATAAGMYRIEAYLADTTADLAAGAVTLTLSWTDDVGATTATLTQVLTGIGRSVLDQVLYLASGNITFGVSHTGIFGSAQYAYRIRCAYLG